MTEPTAESLPIESVLEDIVAALREQGAVTISAPSGSGKTTRVAPRLLHEVPGRIIVLEPRRVAARAAARRMAEEHGEPLGGTVGYQVRFDRRIGSKTRLEVVTEGVFLRRLQEDPWLEGVSAVVFDEFHERRLETDLALALTRRVKLELRDDLWIVVMSATFEAEAVSRYLGSCARIESQGRLHPVEIEHLGIHERGDIWQSLPGAVDRTLEQTEGDLLVFLPGVGEIRRAERVLSGIAERREILLAPLYGDLPAEQQDAVLRPSARRRIVLATNVAETSVTLPSVDAVVDLGLARVPRYDPGVGLDRLELEPISKASATQRAGRAGRLRPGRCLRLWTAGDHRQRPDETPPDIERVDLSGAVLQLHAWGEPDAKAFSWFEAPPEEALDRAESLLRALGALDAHGITPSGRRMVELPASPRLARLLLEGERLGHPETIALAAALLAERDPFQSERGPITHHSDSDVLDRCRALESFQKDGRRDFVIGRLSVGPARSILRAREQLLRSVRSERAAKELRPREEALGKALLAAFPDRLAKRRGPGDGRGVLIGGRGIRLSERSAVREPELFLCLDIEAGRRGQRSEAIVRMASACHPDWLPESGWTTRVELEFDAEKRRVRASRRLYFEDLLMQESPCAVPPGEDSERLLAEAASADLEAALGLDRPEVRGLIRRLEFLSAHRPELELPVCDAGLWREILPDLCRGRQSFEDLRRAPLLDLIRSRLSWEQQVALDREAPESWPLRRRQARLQYRDEGPPVLAARIQELFGLEEAPRIAGGRARVLVHLLAPNGRPQQITDDLPSFWTNTYPVVRKELRRRYPKHAWPEDPRAPER